MEKIAMNDNFKRLNELAGMGKAATDSVVGAGETAEERAGGGDDSKAAEEEKAREEEKGLISFDVPKITFTAESKIRKAIRSILLEEDQILGEPDLTAQEEDEEEVDEVNTLAGLGSGLGPNMPLGSYDPEKPKN